MNTERIIKKLCVFLLVFFKKTISISFLIVAFMIYAQQQPNILLIVVDDMGWSDLGCYGGEINTPNLDLLADEGIRFNEYYVNPMCVVTRTSLLTGHTHSQSDEYRRSIPIGKLMQKAGYATSISGKWHQPGNPLDAGFDSFYGFLHGHIDSWTGCTPNSNEPQIQKNRNAPEVVERGWYATDAFTDDAIEQINGAIQSGKPFFSYLAYNAPHTPLHAYEEDVEKYYDLYKNGWKTLRKQRFNRMMEMGLIDSRYVDTPPNGEVRRWNEMDLRSQQQEARRMAAYAGMLDRVDQNIGRIIHHLKKKGVAENTLLIFFSDNGGGYSNGDIHTYDQQIPWKQNTFPATSNGWSYLKNTPFRWYKSSAEGGGISSPLIVRWPNGLKGESGSIQNQRLHVTDFYPTFLDLAGIEYLDTDNSRQLEPLYGNSILPAFNDPTLSKLAIHNEIFWSFNDIGKGLLKDNWKISSINDGQWRLYNIKDDPCTTRNLAVEMPEVLKKMSDEWFKFARERTSMPQSSRLPLRDYQEGWGFHRIRMVMPAYLSAIPNMAQENVPRNTKLTFKFSAPIGFENSKGKTIRLYKVGNADSPVWEADPEPGNIADGKTSITFKLPELEPKSTYFLLADSGWITLGKKPVGPINDGAYWYRFRTGTAYE